MSNNNVKLFQPRIDSLVENIKQVAKEFNKIYQATNINKIEKVKNLTTLIEEIKKLQEEAQRIRTDFETEANKYLVYFNANTNLSAVKYSKMDEFIQSLITKKKNKNASNETNYTTKLKEVKNLILNLATKLNATNITLPNLPATNNTPRANNTPGANNTQRPLNGTVNSNNLQSVINSINTLNKNGLNKLKTRLQTSTRSNKNNLIARINNKLNPQQ